MRRLIFIYIMLVAVIIIRIISDSGHYTTPDSNSYIHMAESFSNFGSPTQVNFSLWAKGYPICIALVHTLTAQSFLISSKIVNFIFLALTFWVLYKWFGEKAWFVALVFLSVEKLEIYSYTWSETGFLFFLVLLCYVVSNEKNYSLLRLTIYISLSLLGLFLSRYVGIIYFALIGMYASRHWYLKDTKRAFAYVWALVIPTIVAVMILYFNKINTGHFSGGERTIAVSETSGNILLGLLYALFKEFNLMRNQLSGTIDYLFLGTLFIQLLFLYPLIKYGFRAKGLNFEKIASNTLFQFGIFYLISITLLRLFFHFDIFDLRILSPFSLPILMAIFIWIYENNTLKNYRKWVVGYMFLALLFNLPKAYLLNLFFHSNV